MGAHEHKMRINWNHCKSFMLNITLVFKDSRSFLTTTLFFSYPSYCLVLHWNYYDVKSAISRHNSTSSYKLRIPNVNRSQLYPHLNQQSIFLMVVLQCVTIGEKWKVSKYVLHDWMMTWIFSVKHPTCCLWFQFPFSSARPSLKQCDATFMSCASHF